ncbi:MAG: IS1634 family transposase [Planctomycetaceae bacterium]|nr:IS1634 family transposase [Planctomycetaceae bacterium]
MGNISHLPPEIIDIVRRSLRGEAFSSSGESFEIVRSLPHGHIAAVLGTLRNLELDNIISSRRCRERDLVIAMIAARIVAPASKLATARGLDEDTRLSSLANALGLDRATEDDLYEAMDWVVRRQTRIEKELAARSLSDGAVVLYDLTSVRYTGRNCSLAKLGRQDREGRKRFPQVAFGLLCNAEGCPVGVEVFAGNTSDAKTVGAQVQKVMQEYGIKRMIAVGDRGIVTDAVIRDEFSQVDGLNWVGALRAPAIRKLARDKSIQMSLFDERELAEIASPDYPDERLVVCRNPSLAQERARVREELLKATEAELDEIAAATRRKVRPLRGKDKIGIRVGKILNRHKVGKHFILKIAGRRFSHQRNTNKIAEEAALDGIYVIRTNVPKKVMSADEAVHTYKDLAVVERAFRCLKNLDLKVRPIHHRLEDRVRAHVFLCMLAYYVEWHMRKALLSMTFTEEDPEWAENLRGSVVAPAQRSPIAEFKEQSKRTLDDRPAHSFQTLIQDLGTIALNRIRPRAAQGGGSGEFDMVTTPTPLQRHALDLLGVKLTL